MKKIMMAATVLATVLGFSSSAQAATLTINYPGYTFVKGETVYDVVGCKAGKFEGWIKMSYYKRVWRSNKTGAYHNAYWWISSHDYTIYRTNGQSGGNKANINITYEGTTKKSPDSMKQDGKAHNYSNTMWSSKANQDKLVAPGQGPSAKIQFIFDKSGTDPKCDATLRLK